MGRPSAGDGHDEQAPASRDADSSSELATAFRREWTGAHDATTASADLLPVRLTRAFVAVLPVDGAGLSLHETDLRVPIGASDEVATLAERLQFTQGEGPCIDSAAHRRLMVADTDELERRWPWFTAELFRHTPYRAVVSIPLAITRRSFAALDLFLVSSAAVETLSLTDLSAVSGELADALSSAVSAMSTGEPADPEVESEPGGLGMLPAWLHSAPAQARTYVWVAMGMMMTEFHLGAADALALLRSYSYSRAMQLDDVAAGVVTGTINVAEMAP